MKTLFILILTVLTSLPLSSQQLPIFNQYREHSGYLNPAALPVDYFITGVPEQFYRIGGGHRMQWVGNESFVMQSSILGGEGVTNLGSVSLLGGGYFLHDEVDVTSSDGFFGRGAVYVGDPRNSFWGGLGFYAAYVLHQINVNKLRTYHPNDPKLNYANLSSWVPDLGAGLFGVYQWDAYDRVLFFGVSAPQLLESDVTFENDQLYDYTRLRHIFGHATYLMNLAQRGSFLELSAWVKYIDGIPPHYDFNIRYQINTPIWIGAGGSSASTIHLEVGTNFAIGGLYDFDTSQNYLKVAYGFDFPFDANYASYFGGSHEIHLSYIIH